jgi:hypothetical protein
MTRAILDTSVVIAGDDPAVLRALPTEAAISVATIAELHFGVGLAKTPEAQALRLRRLGAIEAAFEALPIDPGVARAYGQVALAIVRAGRKPRARVMDLWIAATALAHGVPLLTRNARDFSGLEGLVRITSVLRQCRSDGPEGVLVQGELAGCGVGGTAWSGNGQRVPRPIAGCPAPSRTPAQDALPEPASLNRHCCRS